MNKKPEPEQEAQQEEGQESYAADKGKQTFQFKLELRTRLILVFAAVMLIPIVALTVISWNQVSTLSNQLREITVYETTVALNDISRNNLERMTTDMAASLADFLYQRDQDILLLSKMMPSDASYKSFSDNRNRSVTTYGEWTLSDDRMTWVEVNPQESGNALTQSSNAENNNTLMGSGFQYRPPEEYSRHHEMIPLYDEITYIGMDGQEIYKYVSPDSPKVNYPLNLEKADISDPGNTYIRAESYWEKLQELSPGEIYVSELIGAYVGTNYIGMYTPGVLSDVPSTHPNYHTLRAIADLPAEQFIEAAKSQAFAGIENPVGQRFEGIIRWATPMTDDAGEIMGYVTMALNQDHILDFINHITPLEDRNTVLADATEGNYAFLTDHLCRSIAHPRHHSIVGYNPLTGEPQVPWLEGTPVFERNYATGEIIVAENGIPIPVLDDDGRMIISPDSPFGIWYNNGGEQWLESNPSWNNLSAYSNGTSWGQFYEENKDNGDILPQFGERPLRDMHGTLITDNNGNVITDSQSLLKTPARALTAAGFVGLDGRYLNNAPQCTGWMELTEDGGSGSFYVYWNGMLKTTTAGAIPYYTGNRAPEAQGNSRGFGIVSIGAGLEDFTEPAIIMEEHLNAAIARSLREIIIQIGVTGIAVFALIIIATFLITSTVTKNLTRLAAGLARFRAGERSFRLNSKATDEFGALANAFDDMADSIENSIKTPLVIIDKEYKIIYANDHALNMLHKELEDVVGLNYRDIGIYPANSPYDPIKALHEGRDAEVLHRDSDDRYIKGSADYLYDQNGNKSGYIILSVDVTEIQTSKSRAEAANEAKTNFLSNMSHEIRTPLNVIMGMTAIGKESNDIEAKNNALNQINNASKHLLGIIDDILDVSKIESNRFSLSPVSFPLDEAIEKIKNLISFSVKEKRQNFSVNIDKDIPNELFGDEQRLSQVLMNILSNAVKFTAEEGNISLNISLESRENKYCTIRFTVKDNGIGISQEQQKLLFEAFSQVDAGSSRRFGGTGLGLLLSKNIIEMMDGKIRVDSELNKGTEVSFTVRLPYDMYKRFETDILADTGTINPDEPVDFSAYTLLLAEDIEINREIVIVLLERTNIKIDCAENGTQAVEMYKANPEKYDLIFMDIQMPEMDGYTATKLIRESGTPRATGIPIIAMTAHVFKDDIKRHFAAGMNDYIGKPVEYDVMVSMIRKYLHS